MDEEKKEDKDDEQDAVVISLGFVKVNLVGATVALFLPYIGWAMIVLAVSYAATVVIGSMQ